MYSCQSLLNGFCQTWINSETGELISASNSTLVSGDMVEAFALGFTLSATMFLVAYAVKTIRHMLHGLD